MARQPPVLHKTSSGKWAFRAHTHLSEQMFDFELNPGHGEYDIYPSQELMAWLRENDPGHHLSWIGQSILLVAFDRPDVEVAFRLRFDAALHPTVREGVGGL